MDCFVKILLAYHKKDVLFKNDIFTPIHAGRAAAINDYSLDPENLKWFFDNTIGDNTGENISLKNHLYNEMTAVYWAWKNYDELSNPKYIGLMHYRRHFIFEEREKSFYECDEIDDDYLNKINYSEDNIMSILKACDFVCSAPQWRDSLYKHYERNHSIEDLDCVIQIINDLFPKYRHATKKYLDGHIAYFCNMFIFEKEIFFRYCEFVFGVCQELEKRNDMTGKRLFVSEWLTGIFITKLLMEGKKGKFLPTMFAEGKHEVSIAMAADDNYAFPTFVSLCSLFENAKKNTKYSVYLLLSKNFSDDNYLRINQLLEKYPTHSIKTYNMGDSYVNENISIKHISVSTYYRLQLPSLLNKLDKCIYLDVDTVVKKDLSDLWRINIDDKYIAGVRAAGYYYPQNHVDRILKELDIPVISSYVNAGVLLMNLKKMRNDKLEEVFSSLLMKKYSSQDQHILNKACFGKIRIIEPCYNMMNKYDFVSDGGYYNDLCLRSAYLFDEWERARKNPYVIHFADRLKPWNDYGVSFSSDWWDYALKLPYSFDVMEKYSSVFIPKVLDREIDLAKKIILSDYQVISMIAEIHKGRKQIEDLQMVLSKKDNELRRIQSSIFWKINNFILVGSRKLKTLYKIFMSDGFPGIKKTLRLKRIKRKH